MAAVILTAKTGENNSTRDYLRGWRRIPGLAWQPHL
jgi:hypothetical protein